MIYKNILHLSSSGQAGVRPSAPVFVFSN
jgi:hypothetical protein